MFLVKQQMKRKWISVALAASLVTTLALPTMAAQPAYAASNLEVQQAAAQRIVSGTTYYVSNAGNDANDGKSESAPWKTLEHVNLQQFRPGDQILFKAGDVWDGSLKLRNTSGTKEAPIIFDKYGSTDPDIRPIINGNGTTTTEESAIVKNYSSVKDKTMSATIDVVDGSYLQFHNFELTNSNPNVVSQRAGINIRTASTTTQEWEANPHRGIVVKNNYVHDVDGNPKGWKIGSGGILILGNISDVLVDGNIVKRVDIEGIRNAGLYKEGDIKVNFPRVFDDIIFTNNYVEETQGDGFVMSNVGKNGRMEYNTVVKHSAKNVGNVNYAGLWVIGVKDMIMQYNEVYGGIYGYNDGQAFDVDMFSEGTLYQYNYSHSNRGGFILFMGGSTSSVVRYNMSVNDGDGRYIFHYLPTTANDAPLIHNNTFFTDEHIQTKLVSDPGKYLKMYNNIFYSKANTPIGQDRFAGGEVSHNIFYPGTGIKEQKLTNLSLDNNLFVSPQFARAGEEPSDIINMNASTFDVEKLNGYKLLPGSPAIDAGKDMTALTPSAWELANVDFFRNPITDQAKVDIGAHEFSNDAPIDQNPEVMPASITLSESSLHLLAKHPGTKLSADIGPADAWFKTVKWSSSNPAVAKIGADGIVHPLAAGETTIRVESTVNPSIYAEAQVKVQASFPYELLNFDFDGQVQDQSQEANHGTAIGNPTYVQGQFKDQAIQLTESDTVVLDANKLKLGTDQNFTVAFWMKSGSQSSDNAVISNKDWSSGANQGWLIGVNGDKLIWNYKGASAARLDVKKDANITVGDNKWHHVVVSHDRTGEVTFYVDNKMVKSVSIAGTGNIDTALPVTIGADANGKYSFTGALDDLKVYGAALDRADVSVLYESYFAAQASKEQLTALIDQANAQLNTAVEGIKPGEYKQGSKSQFQLAIQTAQGILSIQDSTQVMINASYASLTKAVAEF